MSRRARAEPVDGEGGQVLVLLVGALVAVLAGVFVLGAVARGVGRQGDAQRAADLAALAGARTMHRAYPRLFEAAVLDGLANLRHLEKADYVAMARAAAERVAAANGDADAEVAFPDGASFAPVRIRVRVRRRIAVAGRGVTLRALAEAELGAEVGGGFARGGGYDGPPAVRQGKPMRPDVAAAFDRMTAAASADAAGFAPTPSRPSSSRAIPIPNGLRRRGSRCTATAPSSTSGRAPPTAGWRPTRRAFSSSSATRGTMALRDAIAVFASP